MPGRPPQVPEGAYWGPQTQRTLETLSLSDQRLPPGLIRALGIVKHAVLAAHRNRHPLPAAQVGALGRAAEDVILGGLNPQFPLDPFQSDAAHNANANEVIANRALELAGRPKWSFDAIDPEAHVNLGLNATASLRAALQIALLESVAHELRPPLRELGDEVAAQAQTRADLRAGLTTRWAEVAQAGAKVGEASARLKAVTFGLPDALDASAVAHLNDVSRLDYVPAHAASDGPDAVRATLAALAGLAEALNGLCVVVENDAAAILIAAAGAVRGLAPAPDRATALTAWRWLPAIAALGHGVERFCQRGLKG